MTRSTRMVAMPRPPAVFAGCLQLQTLPRARAGESVAALGAHCPCRVARLGRVARDLVRGQGVAGGLVVGGRGEDDAVHATVRREQRAAAVARADGGTQ